MSNIRGSKRPRSSTWSTRELDISIKINLEVNLEIKFDLDVDIGIKKETGVKGEVKDKKVKEEGLKRNIKKPA